MPPRGVNNMLTSNARQKKGRTLAAPGPTELLADLLGLFGLAVFGLVGMRRAFVRRIGMLHGRAIHMRIASRLTLRTS